DTMTPVAFTVDEQDTIGDAIEMMLEAGIHRVIVTGRGGIVGIVSTMDIVRLVPGILGEDQCSVPTNPSTPRATSSQPSAFSLQPSGADWLLSPTFG
ncbi:MAG: CBS domain-containing protein, partial [Candidatus Xenobia bacterium]